MSLPAEEYSLLDSDRPLVHNQLMDKQLCSGYGPYHSPRNKRHPRALAHVTLRYIERLAQSPDCVPKQSAQWFIPSTLLSRSHRDQWDYGSFHALWADVDDATGYTFKDMVSVFRRVLDARFIAYTTRSATHANPKCRVIVPLAHAVSGAKFVALQDWLCDQLELAGIKVDRAACRAGQICYVPNRGAIYSSHVHDVALFDPTGVTDEPNANANTRRPRPPRPERPRVCHNGGRDRADVAPMGSWYEGNEDGPVEVVHASAGKRNPRIGGAIIIALAVAAVSLLFM